MLRQMYVACRTDQQASWYVPLDPRDSADICGHDGVLCRRPVHSDRPIGAIEKIMGHSDLDFGKACASAEAMCARLPILQSDEDEVLLRQAGFSDPALFYAAFSFRGWVARA
jgi:hypothetical protein